MRYEAKTEADAVEAAAQALGVPAAELKYRVIRDEKSFWGGRVVEIEVEEPAQAPRVARREPRVPKSKSREPGSGRERSRLSRAAERPPQPKAARGGDGRGGVRGGRSRRSRSFSRPRASSSRSGGESARRRCSSS